ncbi:unnamed protein product [Rotaria sp. Silwood1]|nr:unnamed protein product [Rotaria sp. Silwood1]
MKSAFLSVEFKEELIDFDFILLLGKGYVDFSLPDSKTGTEHYFQIQEFRTPEYEVSSIIRSPVAYYCHSTVDQHVIAICEGQIIGGGHLSGANVQWTVHAEATKFIPEPSPIIVYALAAITDLNSQTQQTRANFLIHPCKYYVGFQFVKNYGTKDKSVKTKVTVTDIDGNLIDNILVQCKVVGYGKE